MSYEYYFSAMEEELAMGAMSGLITGIPGFVVNIAVYIFTALSLYTLAKRRGLKRAWLSWIPVGNIWILGSLADQFRYVMRGETKSKRKVLLVLNIAYIAVAVVFFVLFGVMMVNVITGAMGGMDEDRLLRELMGSLAGMMGMLIPMLGVAIAMGIIRYMALYDLYTSCDPNNKVIFLVVGILIPITEPVFLFLCRNKDYGMPPRRDSQPVIDAAYSYQAPQYQGGQYQAPQYQQSQYQAPQYQQSQYQAPQYQQNQYQAPQYQQSQYQAPQYQQSQYQAPQYQQSQYQAPQYQQPQYQAPQYRHPQQPQYQEPEQPSQEQ